MCTVEIIYALISKQELIQVTVKKDSTIEEAIIQSSILDKYCEIDLQKNKVGIFNQVKSLTQVVHEGDRIEIYRPLIANPKEVRRKRAVKQRDEGVIK